jgi:putative acetyltransferase
MKARPYQSADLPGVVETYTASIRVSAASFYSPEQIEAWAPVPTNLDRWRERLAQRHTIVAETDGALAGFVSYTSDGYLDFLSTHPAFARRGVASKLYQCVESTLIAAGVPKVTAHVSLAARRFFEHHGFQVDAEEEIECRGVFLRRFGMHKDLADKRVAEPTRCSEPGDDADDRQVAIVFTVSNLGPREVKFRVEDLEWIAKGSDTPRGSVPDAHDDRTLDSLPAPGSGGGR